MVDVIFWAWVCGWVGITAAAAVIGGNQDRDDGPPMWEFSLMLGWSWPFLVLLAAVTVPFALLGDLSDRYRNRKGSDNGR